MKSQGLGDAIEKITTSIGIKALFDKHSGVDGKPCVPCSKRKETLNNPNLLINKILFKDNV